MADCLTYSLQSFRPWHKEGNSVEDSQAQETDQNSRKPEMLNGVG